MTDIDRQILSLQTLLPELRLLLIQMHTDMDLDMQNEFRNTIVDKIIRINDEEQLALILQESIQLLHYSDLKTIPIAIMKKLQKIPRHNLTYLLSNDMLEVLYSNIVVHANYQILY